MIDQAPILIVDGVDGQTAAWRDAFSGLRCMLAADGEEALLRLRQYQPCVVLVGICPGDKSDGWAAALDLMGRLIDLEPATKVVLTLPTENPERALEAIGRGAWEVLAADLPPPILRFVLERGVELTRMERELRRRISMDGGAALPGIIGKSPATQLVCQQVLRVAPTDASVILTGESGTGKEVVARALHASSTRADRRFVAINCAAIPETLLESELFGYERGAFTGAVKLTPGRIELADGGTLFLDEIGDLPLSLQAKLLRFLQERVIERIGGRREIAVDVRLVCATHRDLAGLIVSGGFREDLFYRLSEIALHLPPLRERDGDAVLLAHHFMAQYGASAARPLKGFTRAALHTLDRHSWPGNVRELQNRVKRAVIMANGPRIEPRDLDLPDHGEQTTDLDLRRRREEVEQSVLRRALARCNGNLASVARLIGVSRPTLYDLLRQHGLRDDPPARS